MAHFAKIENNIVTNVIVISDNYQDVGQEFINNNLKLEGTWLQTSYNTIEGVHVYGGTPFRKNFAGVGDIYDSERDAFYAPQPFPSWVLDEDKCIWEAPVAYPDDDQFYIWNEETVSWELEILE
jgi:hypothetical protein